MNSEVVAAVERLRFEGVLSAPRAELLERAARDEIVSLRIEIRAALYVGVLLVTSGVGLFVKENSDRIGPAAIGLAVGLAAAACLSWALRRSAPFTWQAASPTHAAFDYVLLLGALLVATDLAYLETQTRILGPDWPWHLLAVAVFYIALAYRFDSRMLLALALTSFAAWRGISVRLAEASLGRGDASRLRIEALGCGVLFGVLGIASARTGRKAHFEDVYTNAGLLLALGGLLSGVLASTNWGAWLAALLVSGGAIAVLSFRRSRTLPFALAAVGSWVGLQRLIFEGARANASAALLLSAASAVAALFLIAWARRRMRFHEE